MKNNWFNNFKSKFKVVIIHPETYEEKGGFNMSKMKLTTLVVVYSLILVAGTASLIFFTSLRELIPGYTDVTLDRRVYNMERRADSLEEVFHEKDVYIENLKRIIYEEDMSEDDTKTTATVSKPNIKRNSNLKSDNDSLFRVQFEAETQYNLFGSPFINSNDDNNFPVFFVPVNGYVTNHFNSNNKHFGVDVVAKTDAVITAVADGTVFFSDWSADGGYTIGIQHGKNFISVYKHNASILRHEGELVKAGDAIAVIGSSGGISTGPHLHFELWYKGRALNPEDYISFEVK